MNILRSSLLTGAAVAFCGLAAAQLVPGGAPVAPTPSEPVPATEPANATGVMTATSIDELQTIFQGAGVPYEVVQASDGRKYVVGKVQNLVLAVSTLNCADKAGQKDCTVVTIESGTYVKPASLQLVNEFNKLPIISRAQMASGTDSYLQQIVMLHSGVAPTYLRQTFARFTEEMKIYADILVKASEGGAASPTGGSFASSELITGFDNGDSRAGREAFGAEITGHSEAGAFGK